ncbi:hypothetical protein EV175_006523 [Coemansia sp. RSA 1933]|nr:hypothetical protein EV175_006523 [Coemansia sp. RSA 1933]
MTASSSVEPEPTVEPSATSTVAQASVPEAESREANGSAQVPDAATVPNESNDGYGDVYNEPAEPLSAEYEYTGADQDVEDVQADDAVQATSGGSALDPVKSPALANVKRLVRRGPRQMPTTEALKKGSEESQAQSLRTALQKDKSVEPEPEVEAETVRAARPALPEKPRGISGRFGQQGGPHLPSGGFKASGRVGSAMASRLAALQARASGNNDDDEGNANDAAANGAAEPASASGARSLGASNPPPPADAKSPPPVGRKPSFTPRTSIDSSANVSAEWQKQIEEEQSRLRSDINKAKHGSETVERLESRLAASERENQMHKQTISRLEEHIQALTRQMSALKTDISGIQQSVSELGSNKGVSADEITSLLHSELRSVVNPLATLTQELSVENKALDKKISDLRAYVDELVVDEE